MLDSRGNPTVCVLVKAGNEVCKALVPSGVSTGVHEAVELRDGGKRYNGLGVRKALQSVALIGKKLKGFDVHDQEGIDSLMVALDDTENKSDLGGNAITGVSLACAKFNLKVKRKVDALPYMNVIEGGVHASNKLSFQEYHIVPKAKSFSERLRIGTEVYHELGKKLKCGVGDEGGYNAKFSNVRKPLDVLCKVIDNLGYNVKLSLDVAASEFYRKGKYKVDGKLLSPTKLLSLYETLIKTYPIMSIEDPFAQDDWMNWYLFNSKFKLQVVGDDLLVTNVNRIRRAVKAKACNALLLKVNQIGTVTEAMVAAKLARKSNWNVIVSHRGGDVTDSVIADLAVNLKADVKFGAPCRGERVIKYNRLLEIEKKFI